MERDMMLAPLCVDKPELARRFAEGLREFGYRTEEIRQEVPEAQESGAGATANQAEIAARLTPDRPLACLIRAFLLRAATAEETLRAQLGEAFFAVCEEAGLWERVEGGVVGRVVVVIAQNGTFLLSDHTRTQIGEKEMHWVMAIGGSTMRVANSIERRRYGRVLDLCCGGGVQAFLLAEYAEEIVAIDRNERALNFGRFAAAMNGFSNIEFRQSDCYSAVAGEQFDLIVCNPPYVIAPDLRAYYREGGMGGDRFAEKLLREAGAYLREGGLIHAMCDVASLESKPSRTRLQEWFAGTGCDVLGIADLPVLPPAYADRWLKPGGNQAPEEQEFEKHRWVQNLMNMGVESIENWVVAARRRTGGGPNWFQTEKTPARALGSFGHQIARLFRGQDLIRQPDAAIWATTLRIPSDVRMRNVVRPVANGWAAESARLTFSEGMIMEFGVDPGAAEMLVHFDRERTAEAALRRIAAEMRTDMEGLRGQLLGFLRHMIGNGLLEAA